MFFSFWLTSLCMTESFIWQLEIKVSSYSSWFTLYLQINLGILGSFWTFWLWLLTFLYFLVQLNYLLGKTQNSGAILSVKEHLVQLVVLVYDCLNNVEVLGTILTWGVECNVFHHRGLASSPGYSPLICMLPFLKGKNMD